MGERIIVDRSWEHLRDRRTIGSPTSNSSSGADPVSCPFLSLCPLLVDPVHQYQPDPVTLLGPAFVSLGFHRNYHKVGVLNRQKVVLLGLRRPKVQNQGARGLGPF